MLQDESSCEVSYKVLILGDRGVGKTALLNSLVGKQFQELMHPTIGADFVRKTFLIDGASVQLIIWDLPGHESLWSDMKQHFKDVKGILLVYDTTNEATFEFLNQWINIIQCDIGLPRENYEPTPLFVCGNKSDLTLERKVSKAKGQEFSDKEMMFGFYETSAKTGKNVQEIFQCLAYQVIDICNPELMKSYHPFSYKPNSQGGVTLKQEVKLREFNSKKQIKNKRKSSAKVTLQLNKMTAKYRTNGTSSSNFITDLSRQSECKDDVWNEGRAEKTKNKKISVFRLCLCGFLRGKSDKKYSATS